MAYANKLPSRSENFSEWYTSVIQAAELADYGPVKGTMIMRPYGYAIWERIQSLLDAEIKKRGVGNAYFPMFIPESFLQREKDHVEGFSPELAVVTVAGGEELAEKLVVRPTSETIICESFAKWTKSWRDLPMQINQWNNVVRWEKRTALFLRTSEFLWQEGHTIHATHEEASDTVNWAIETYAKLYRDALAMPGLTGRKSETEKFAGADTTLTYETLMPDGKALQSCTSHDLGQNFAKSFDIAFQDKEGVRQHVWQTSWGLSTRSMGGLIMLHGDDNGLRLPPVLAPIQVVILPVRAEEDVLAYCIALSKSLLDAGIRVQVDSTDDESLGRRINKWELKGVPVRIEVGRKEMESDEIKLVRRDTGEASFIASGLLVTETDVLLQSIQQNLLTQAEHFLVENTRSADNYETFKEIMNTTRGFIEAYWCGDADCEKQIKDETKATTRCFARAAEPGACVHCGGETTEKWYFAQAY